MSGPQSLRDATNRLLEALRMEIGLEARNAAVSLSALDEVFDRFMTSPDYLPFFQGLYRDLAPAVLPACRRVDPLGRLLISPLQEPFRRETLGRDILPNLFSFFHLVLGEDLAGYGAQCQSALDQLRPQNPGNTVWQVYLQTPAVQQIYWQVLIRIATLFNKRWDMRKDWFFKLMQYNPTTSSLGPMAFQLNAPAAPPSSAPKLFDEAAFAVLFQTLFDLPPPDINALRRLYGPAALAQIQTLLGHL